MTTDGGGAVWSHILPGPINILSRESFSNGQLRFIWEMVIVEVELLLIFQDTLFVSTAKLLIEKAQQGEVVFVGGGWVAV